MHSTDHYKILVADDHAVVRAGVIKAISQAFPSAIVTEAGNSAEISRLLIDTSPHLVLLDISMPGRSGLDILNDIIKEHPGTKVIIFSMYPEDQFAIRAIKAGASAYVTKDTRLSELVEIIRKILLGQRHISPAVADLMFNEIHDKGNKQSHEQLSDREYEVLLLIASGKAVSEIAAQLSLSVKTISIYRANILRKMNLHNNAEIMHYAFKNSLVE